MAGTEEASDLRSELNRRLQGKVLLIGAGNTLRGDDGAGPLLVELLEGKTSAGLLDVGEVLESYSGRILQVQADAIVLIDAADFGAAPGDVALMEPEAIMRGSVSTHQIPMTVFFRYIHEHCSADLFAIGIQPSGIGFGEPMSSAVAGSVHALAEILQELLPIPEL